MPRIEVIQMLPERRHRSMMLQLADGARVSDALAASGWTLEGVAGHAVFGMRVNPDHVLQDGDRLELLGPLRADPKQARRARAASQPKRG